MPEHLTIDKIGVIGGIAPLDSEGKVPVANLPAIPVAQVQTDWNASVGMGVLLNKPTIISLVFVAELGSFTTTIE